MLFFDGALALVAFALWVFCVIDVITTPEDQCRNLPKMIWLLLVIVLVDVGSIAWLVAGHPWANRAVDRPFGATRRPPASRISPDDDDEFLASLRARAEEQRRRAREANQHEDEPPATG
ncbi:MAG: hypothetical protein QOJ34_1329 [Pseudonocardiales bacterium]|nr:hypothetical protein [Pseudonocardiales bacterium]